MADNVTLSAGTADGAVIATDDDSGVHHQYVKVEFGGDGTFTKVTTSAGLPTDVLDRAARDLGKVDVASLDQYTPVDVDSGGGTENAVPVTLRIAASGGSIAQTYGSGNVDAGTQRVTIATDSAGVLSVDDNGTTLSVDDGGGVLTVDGTVIVQDGGGAISIDDGGNVITVDGTVTVQDGGGALTVDNGGTFAVQESGAALTALQLIDDAVYVDDADWTNDTSKHVLVGGLYQASQQTVTDGDVAPLAIDQNGNLRVNIVAGAAAGGTSQADDADFSAGTTAGTPAMGVYESSPSSVTDGDLGTVGITQTRAMRVNVDNTVTVGSHAVTNAGTFAVQESGNALTALQLIDDVVYADDADWTDSTSKHVLVGGLYQGTPQTVTDGDVGPLQIDENGVLKVNVVAGAGSGGTASADDADFAAGTTNGTPAMGVYESSPSSVTDGDLGVVGITQTRQLRASAAQEGTWNIGTVTAVTAISNALPAGTNAIGKLAANSGVDIGDVDVTSIAAGDNNIGNVDIVTVPADPFGANADAASATGSISAKLRQIAANGIPVTSLPASTNTIEVVGDAAHGATAAGNPLRLGLTAETSPKGITLVTDGQATAAYGDADGIQMVKLNTSGADLISEAVSNTDGNSTAFSNFGAVASTFNYVTSITAFRTDAGTSMAFIDFRDGTAGSVKWRMPLPPNGGSTVAAAQPLFKTSANTALAYDVSAALTTVYISVSGFQSKV